MLGLIGNVVLSLLLIKIGTPTWAVSEPIKQLTFTQLAQELGRDVEEYDVITEDEYILTLFHIKGEVGLPILLVHGALDSADIYIARGEKSLSITLADQGYDVWVMNVRGSRYGNRNLRLNSESEEFWNFTFQELALYDLPANIDFILEKANATKLNAIGHSQGNLIFYILGSLRPEYNEKVNTLTALAPISYCQNFAGLVSTLASIGPSLQNIANRFNIYHLFVDGDLLRELEEVVCPIEIMGYDICVMSILFPLIGFDQSELEPEFFSRLIPIFPSSTSIKNLAHFAQLYNNRKLAQYDYGEPGNLAVYNTSDPPEYDLSSVTIKVYLLQAQNDFLSREEDTNLLIAVLPNVANYTVIARNETNNYDFVIGRTNDQYIYQYVLDVLENNLE